jgi:hypothetical protein
MSTPASPVRPEFGPTLPAFARARLGALSPLAKVAIAAFVVAIAVGVFAGVRAVSDLHYVATKPFEFNLRHSRALPVVAPRRGELLRLEQHRGGRFVQSFALKRIALPAYRGDSGGILPILATRLIDAGPRRYAGFELSQEGRARVVKAAAYSFTFRARLGKRSLLGRIVLLPRPGAHPREAVLMELLATPSAGVGTPEDVGALGLTKAPFRTFRYGTSGA